MKRKRSQLHIVLSDADSTLRSYFKKGVRVKRMKHEEYVRSMETFPASILDKLDDDR